MEKSNKYFTNHENKIKLCNTSFINDILFLTTLLLLKINNDSLKENYTKAVGAVALRVIHNDPELESEIMPVLTKPISTEEASKGQAFTSSMD